MLQVRWKNLTWAITVLILTFVNKISRIFNFQFFLLFFNFIFIFNCVSVYLSLPPPPLSLCCYWISSICKPNEQLISRGDVSVVLGLVR